jgi:uncharacterized protein YgiM (DUF1202 family)
MNRHITFVAVIVVYLIVGVVAFIQLGKMNTAFPTSGGTADISLSSPDYNAYLSNEETETTSQAIPDATEDAVGNGDSTAEDGTESGSNAAEDVTESGSASLSAEYTFTAVHAEGRLFVRESPSMSAKILGSLSPGDSGEVLELGTDWALITSGDLTGYVYTQYLELTEIE